MLMCVGVPNSPAKESIVTDRTSVIFRFSLPLAALKYPYENAPELGSQNFLAPREYATESSRYFHDREGDRSEFRTDLGTSVLIAFLSVSEVIDVDGALSLCIRG